MTLPIEGASGRHYDYTPVDPNNIGPLFLAAANYVFLRWNAPTQFKVIYAGEGSLYEMLTHRQPSLWATAQQKFQATALYARPNGKEESRKEEQNDIVKLHEPPMNA